MQKEGKMLINKEQNQVYPQKKTHNYSISIYFNNEQFLSFIEQIVSCSKFQSRYLCIKSIR